MMCSAYFGELSEIRKQRWEQDDTNPYEVLEEANFLLQNCNEMTYEEELEDDAEGGYFDDD